LGGPALASGASDGNRPLQKRVSAAGPFPDNWEKAGGKLMQKFLMGMGIIALLIILGALLRDCGFYG